MLSKFENFCILLLHPVFYYFVTRNLFPLLYSFSVGYEYINEPIIYVLLTHLFVFTILYLKLLISILKKSNMFSRNLITILSKSECRYINYSFLYGLFVIIYIGFDLPIFGKHGSDSLVVLNEESKLMGLLIAGLILTKLSLVTTFFISKRKLLSFIFLSILCLISGKKAAVLELLQLMTLGFLYYRTVKIYYLKWMLILTPMILYYIIMQYSGSKGVDPIDMISNISELPIILINLVYYASNIHLVQLFEWGALSDFYEYGQKVNALEYFLNPILKFLSLGGVERTLGTYLSYQLFGGDLPTGANMTLPLEAYATSGLFGYFASFVVMIFCYSMVRKSSLIVKRGKYRFLKFINSSIAIIFILFFLADPLNAYRSYIFIFSLHVIMLISSRIKLSCLPWKSSVKRMNASGNKPLEAKA
jgi:hypothetical protein